eukprot:scaffold222572_cov30-Tisochrysis_lutea.AAC.1
MQGPQEHCVHPATKPWHAQAKQSCAQIQCSIQEVHAWVRGSVRAHLMPQALQAHALVQHMRMRIRRRRAKGSTVVEFGAAV